MKVVYVLSTEGEEKLRSDIALRLNDQGYPRTPGNDYELHLFARNLKNRGLTRQEVRDRILFLGLNHIPANKRESYINDILDSVLVGFNLENPQPIYEE
jgi:hypothetical protein